MNNTCAIPLSEQSANQIHLSLKSALATMEKAQQSAVLCFGEIIQRQLFTVLGYGSINQYAEVELGFSATRTNDFIMLCRKLEKLPKVKAKVESGELGYTTARVIVPVLDEHNEDDWLEFALKNPCRVVEREVKRAKEELGNKKSGQPALLPEAGQRAEVVVPTRVGLEFSPVQFARYEALWEEIRKQREAPADKIEALLEMMTSYVAAISPRGEKSPTQIHIHQCPDCATGTVSTSKGELVLSTPELDRAHCDCQISHVGEPNTASVPPAKRRQVLAQARHQCQRPGCRHSHYLEVHHRVPRAHGGSNDLSNLICLCSACHKIMHDKRIEAASWVKSPAAVYAYGTVEKLLVQFPAVRVAPCYYHLAQS